jgi:hypothetical protein
LINGDQNLFKTAAGIYVYTPFAAAFVAIPALTGIALDHFLSVLTPTSILVYAVGDMESSNGAGTTLKAKPHDVSVGPDTTKPSTPTIPVPIRTINIETSCNHIVSVGGVLFLTKGRILYKIDNVYDGGAPCSAPDVLR